jgi:hypothetical protein
MRSRGLALALLASCAGSEVDLRSETGTVFVFMSADCPIANSYAPELAAIAKDYEAARLRFCFVHVDPAITQAKAQAHAREYGLPGEILLDPEHRLCRRLGAKATPEAFVLLPDGTVAYRGRIDDAWAELGQRRRVVTRRELRDALDAVVAGRMPAVRETEPVGCVIE